MARTKGQVSVLNAGFARPRDWLSTHGQAGRRCSQTLSGEGDASGNPMPRVMNVDKNPAAVEALKWKASFLNGITVFG
jgi:hypothetical protein